MAPKVLVSDKLSETAVQIFRDRGIDVTFDPSIGNIRPKFLSTSFKKPKWCTTRATTTPIPANRKAPWA